MYRINVKTINGQTLTFNYVKEYKLENGRVSFLDSKTNKSKNFPSNNCEVEEE